MRVASVASVESTLVKKLASTRVNVSRAYKAVVRQGTVRGSESG